MKASTVFACLCAALALAALFPLAAADPAPAATITLTLQLTQEQVDALTAYTVEWNGTNGTSTVQERLIADVLTPFIKTKTDAAYEFAVKRLGEAAKGLSYEQRTALIQQVQQQITGN